MCVSRVLWLLWSLHCGSYCPIAPPRSRPKCWSGKCWCAVLCFFYRSVSRALSSTFSGFNFVYVVALQVVGNPRENNSISWGLFAGSEWQSNVVGETRHGIGLVQSQMPGERSSQIQAGCLSRSVSNVPGVPMLDPVRHGI
jgi:hypothetical protein